MSERILPQLNSRELEQSPYRVEVNLEGIATLLREQNIPEHDVGRLTINLKESYREGIFERLYQIATHGQYSAEDYSVDLYTKESWDFYCSRLNAPHFPPGIDQEVRQAAILEAINGYLNHTLLHELGHALDPTNHRVRNFLMRIPPIRLLAEAAILISHINPNERRAERFANRLSQDTRWQSLVAIRPKDI